MRFLIAIVVILVVVDGYFYDWYYTLQLRDQAYELIERFRPDDGQRPATDKRT